MPKTAEAQSRHEMSVQNSRKNHMVEKSSSEINTKLTADRFQKGQLN
jgi:hypothetical protein